MNLADKMSLVSGFHLDLASGFDRQMTAEERQKEREAEARERERERESRVYEDAVRARDESRWERAVERFNDVATMKGARVDAALYWKAYSQDRMGQRAEALATIAALSKDYPKSRYLREAKALEAEVRRNAGQPARPQDQADEDLKLMAIAALQHQAPEQAMPDAGEAARRRELSENKGTRPLRPRAERFAEGPRRAQGHRQGQLHA